MSQPDETETHWMAYGHCAHRPPSLFFPSDGVGVVVARRICADCPVKDLCLEYALSHRIDHGVWGGCSERERRRILKRRRLEAAMRLARSPFGRNDPDLSRRIRLAAQTMLSPNEDDWYFSRLALLSNARGVGVGFWLEEQVLAAGRRAGCRRCVLEVTPQSPEAIAIHTRYKFKISSRPRVEDPQTGRWLEYIHMELPL